MLLFLIREEDMETGVKLTLAFIQHKAQLSPKENFDPALDSCSVIDTILEGPSE